MGPLVVGRWCAGVAVVEAAGLPYRGPWRRLWSLEAVGRLVESGAGVRAVVAALADISAAWIEAGWAGSDRAAKRARGAPVPELQADELAQRLAVTVRAERAGRLCSWSSVREAALALARAAEHQEALARGAS